MVAVKFPVEGSISPSLRMKSVGELLLYTYTNIAVESGRTSPSQRWNHPDNCRVLSSPSSKIILPFNRGKHDELHQSVTGSDI